MAVPGPTVLARRDRTLAWAALAAALGALAWRYAFVLRAALTYDEATYADLARHPWFSSYYPDEVFLRHPPLAFLFLWAWQAVFGTSEAMLRLPAFLACAAATTVLWSTVRRTAGDRSAALCAALLAVSFHVLVYGIQNTMYPYAFLLLSLALRFHLQGSERAERAALNAFALTHLFGFVFIGIRLWRARRRPWREAAAFVLPLAWLLLAVATALLVKNRPGPELGPMWQLVRPFSILYDLYLSPLGWLPHTFAFVLQVLLLNPVLIETAWLRERGGTWRLGGLILVVILFTGPAVLRYSFLVLPLVLALGLGPRSVASTAPSRPVLLVIGLSSLLAATAFVNTGYDRSAGNDVPGLVDWSEAVAAVVRANQHSVAGPSAPSLAHYLERDHGFLVSGRQEGPDVLPMVRPDGRGIVVYRAAGDDELLRAGALGALLVVPEPWHDAQARLYEADHRLCGKVLGAFLMIGPSDREGCGG